MTAAERISIALEGKPDLDYGLTEIDAHDVVDVADSIQSPDKIVRALVFGASNALKGPPAHPEDVPLMVLQRTVQLRHLLSKANVTPPPIPVE